MRNLVLAIAFIAACPSTAPAQDVPPFIERGARGVGHEALEPLIGDWDVTMTVYVAGGTAERPLVTQLRGRRDWIGERRFLREVLEGENYWRQGVLGYSTMDERYEFVTQDGMNANMMVYMAAPDTGAGLPISMSGTFTDQGVLGEAYSGVAIGQRTVITIQDRDRHRIDILFTPPGEPERLVDRKDFVRRR